MGNGRAEVLYFIKVPDKFLHCDEIRWIESQEKGSEIILFFLRLLSAAKDRKVIDVYERSISAGTNKAPNDEATNAKTN